MNWVKNIHNINLLILCTALSLLSACTGESSNFNLGKPGGSASSSTTTSSCPNGFTIVNVGGSLSNVTINSGQTHCYVFTAVAGTTYTMAVIPSVGDVNISLYSDLAFTAQISSSANTGTTPDKVTTTASASRDYFVGVNAPAASTYTLELSVGNTTPSIDIAPIASVTPTPSPAIVGFPVTLDGSASNDPDGHPLTYSWTFTPAAGSTSSLSSTVNATTTFTPDLIGTYQYSLVVNDGRLNGTVSGSVTVTNNAPTALINPSPTASILVGNSITLDGTGSSDPDGHPITYRWRQVTGNLTFTDPGTSSITITPTTAMDYVFELIVNDGYADSAPVTTTITAGNTAPVASVTPTSASILVGTTQLLDGSASSDADGQALTYSWTLDVNPAFTHTASTYSFTPTTTGTYTFTLVVNDGFANSAPVQSVITVTNTNPVASIQSVPPGSVGQSSILDGSASSDADGQTLSYLWAMTAKPAGSALSFTNPGTSVATFAPDVVGAYTFDLTVNDGFATNTVSTTVNVTHLHKPLTFKVLDAEYDEPLDKLIMVSSNPVNALYSYDLATGNIATVNLTYAPTSVSVSPNGQFAAVGHSGFVSYINLATNSLVGEFGTSANASDVVLTDTGIIHVMPTSSSISMYSIDTGLGTETAGAANAVTAGAMAKLHPTLTDLYVMNIGANRVERCDISSGSCPGPLATDTDTNPYCGKLWISESGAEIFTGCGHTYNYDVDPTLDMVHQGVLAPITATQDIISLSNSSGVNSTVTVLNDSTDSMADTNVHFYDAILAETLVTPLPGFTIVSPTPTNYAAHGKFVFYNSTGARYLAIVQADASSGLTNDFAIVVSP